ncbi:MAG: TRAP transporter substrate-binding protein DctP [Hyphomicrobiaceae bacterium]
MKKTRFMRTALLSAVSVVALAGTTAAQTKHKFEISLETGPNHIRNIGVTEWAEYLEKQSGGKLEVKIYHGAAKFKDTDIPKALNQGAIDMGLPGTWQLGKYISDFDAVDLPMFYGVSQEMAYQVWDGAPGKFVVDKLEKKLGVKVLGKWLDLGFQHTFSVSKAINTNSDMTAMKLRIPGGAASLARYEALGANPLKISWPDVPQALQRGTIDGLATTFESVRSAKLWDSGVKHAYVNNQSFSQYLPVVGLKSWSKYPKDIQDLLTKSWADRVDDLRKRARDRQASARKDAEKIGVKTVDPTPADVADARKKLMAKQAELIKTLKIDPALVKLIETAMASK